MLGMLIGGTLKTLSDFDYVFYFASLCIFSLFIFYCIFFKGKHKKKGRSIMKKGNGFVIICILICIFVLVSIVIKYNAIPEYILQLLELVLGVICIIVSLLYMKERKFLKATFSIIVSIVIGLEPLCYFIELIFGLIY